MVVDAATLASWVRDARARTIDLYRDRPELTVPYLRTINPPAWAYARQTLGVWEWTATTFGPYPGFERGPYKEYSEPWFGDHRVLRGGCFVTQPRLLRPTWRNFYTPDRNDVWAGFRTCVLD